MRIATSANDASTEGGAHKSSGQRPTPTSRPNPKGGRRRQAWLAKRRRDAAELEEIRLKRLLWSKAKDEQGKDREAERNAGRAHLRREQQKVQRDRERRHTERRRFRTARRWALTPRVDLVETSASASVCSSPIPSSQRRLVRSAYKRRWPEIQPMSSLRRQRNLSWMGTPSQLTASASRPCRCTHCERHGSPYRRGRQQRASFSSASSSSASSALWPLDLCQPSLQRPMHLPQETLQLCSSWGP